MSGFLRSLIERASHRVPVLERRQRALFEPDSARASAHRDMGLQIEDAESIAPAPIGSKVHESPRAPREPVPMTHVPRLAAIEAQRAAITPATHEAPTATVRAKPIEPTASPPRPTAATQDTPASLRVRRIETRIVEAIATPPRVAAAPQASARAETPVRASSVHTPPLSSPVARVRSEQNHADIVPPRRKESRKEPAQVHARMPPLPRETAPAVLLAKAQSAAPAPVVPAPPAPAPVVVSIGRVEVRAETAPPARARAPARSAPRLTLDAYLRDRNGGAR